METQLPVLVLASSSPRRSDLLRAHAIPFEISLPDTEEISDPSILPGNLVQLNAQLKACAVAVRMPDRIVLGADTVVAFEGRVFGNEGAYVFRTVIVHCPCDLNRAAARDGLDISACAVWNSASANNVDVEL